jgi:hypothetical protein
LNDYSFDLSGAGTISGSLEQLPEGIPIVLEGNNGHELSYTLTNASGEFSFQQLPFGTYIVYPEYPGMDNSGSEIQLSAEQPEWNIARSMDQFIASPVIQPDYRINYNRNQQELTITLENGQERKIKIAIYNTLGILLYSQHTDLFESTTIYTGNINTNILLIRIWDGKTLFTKKILN